LVAKNIIKANEAETTERQKPKYNFILRSSFNNLTLHLLKGEEPPKAAPFPFLSLYLISYIFIFSMPFSAFILFSVGADDSQPERVLPLFFVFSNMDFYAQACQYSAPSPRELSRLCRD